MEILNAIDWKILLLFIGLILNLLKDICVIVVALLVKFNDMKHLSEDLKEIKTKLGKVFTRLGKVEKGLVKRDAICEERHCK